MNRPWMPLYVRDYLASTQHLMATESGAYLHLLMHYWETGPLPDDNARLCRIAKVWPPHWKRVRQAVEPFFDLTKRPGLWSHLRADQEITKAEELSNKRKEAAQQKHSKSSAIALQLHTQLQLHNTDSKKVSKKVSKKEEEELSSVSDLGWPSDWKDQFWRLYPNKVGKADALSALDKTRRGGIPFSVVMEGLQKYCSKTDDRPWCNPGTWVRQERWHDQPAPAVPKNGYGHSSSSRKGVYGVDWW